MIEYDICMKSGVGGYYESDGCDLCLLSSVDADCLPRVGDTLWIVNNFYQDNHFVVTEVNHMIPQHNISFPTVYVMPTDGKSYGV